MSEPLADRLRAIVAWIREGGEGCVRQPDPDELEGMADEVEELEYFVTGRAGPLQQKSEARIATLETEMRDAIATLEDSKRENPDGEYVTVWADIDDVLTAQTILLNALSPKTAGEGSEAPPATEVE